MNRLNTQNINGLISVYADTVNSNTDSTTSLYINGQLIDFTSYVTNSYLSSTLSNYITSSFLTSTLSSYVLASNLTSILSSYATTSYVSSNYATTAALSSYRLISDSYNKSDVTNEVVIRTGYSGLNSDGSIKTSKQYTDENIAGVSAVTGTNSASIAALVVWQSATSATLTALQTEVTAAQATADTAEGNATDAQERCTTLETKTQNQTATAGVTNFTGTLRMLNGVNPNVTLNQTGDISCLTETVNTLTCNTELKGNGKLNLSNATQDHILTGNSLTLSQTGKTTSIYGDSNIGAVGSTVQLYGSTINIGVSNTPTSLPVVSIGGLFSTVYLTGAVYCNGRLLIPFQTGPAGGQWTFTN